jgi:uncharacterized protein YkwD
MKLISLVMFFLVFAGLGKGTPERATACLSAEEKKLYDLVMQYRKDHKLGSIPLSENLSYVAQTHARDLAEQYVFDPKNNCNPHSWSTKGKWTSCCYTNDHKKASCMWVKPKELTGYPGNGYEILYYSSGLANAQEGLDGWKVSPGHNPLLVNSGTWANVEWKAIGIGIYKNYGMVWFGDVADPAAPDNCSN